MRKYKKEKVHVFLCKEDIPNIPKEILDDIMVKKDMNKLVEYYQNLEIIGLKHQFENEIEDNVFFCFWKEHQFSMLLDVSLDLQLSQIINFKVLYDANSSENYKKYLNEHLKIIQEQTDPKQVLDEIMRFVNMHGKVISVFFMNNVVFLFREKEFDDDWEYLGANELVEVINE